MAIEFQMPKLGLTMEEGSIIEWLVADGAEVEQGAAVLTIETDKVESDVEASGSGVLHIIGQAGDTFACGERIGWFLQPGETPPVHQDRPTRTDAVASGTGLSPSPTAAPDPAPPRVGDNGARLFASPNARRIAAWRGVDLSRLIGSGPGGRIVSEDVPVAGADGPEPDATVAAHQTAGRLGVDLRDVRAGGPDPRIDRADVERHVREQMAIRPTGTPTEAALAQTPSSTIELAGMRGTIATKMHASLREMAQLTLTMDVVMDAVVRHRTGDDPATRAGYTDYVVAAVARALVDHPVVNSQIARGQLALLPEINVGLAVAIPGGLVVPVVKKADTLSLEALRAETTRLASAARSGELSRDEVEGGTFSVTALGMYGVDAFTPVINPPNTAILGVGRLRDGVCWEGEVPARTTLLTLSLTWDHRAFDGAPAAQFTATVRDRLESWGQHE
jgi:pyruvate dehydrogenase E2 component (dihydrolipoamide acetyltransferase)